MNYFNKFFYKKGINILFCLCMLCTAAFAQTNIRGTVNDNTGASLPGVYVIVKGSANIGTVTDVDGNYTLSVPNRNSVLVFSFVGYTTQEVTVGDRTAINIMLSEDVQLMDELVVVGYGVQRKSDVTGSITRVDAEEFKNLPVMNVEMAFQGRAAGVMIMSESGAPGAGTSVRIRGVGTVNNANDPLYVVDGIPVRDINYLNPSDIASMEILKDASATAIYGSRASNGVVLITTVRGNADGEWKTEIRLDTYYGISNAMNLPKLTGVSGFLLGKRLAYRDNMATYPAEFLDEEAFINATAVVTGSREGTDWIKTMFRTGSVQNINLNIRGGNRRFSYMTSAGYMKDEGTIVFSDFTRLTLRANADFNISDRVKLTTNVNVTHSDRHSIFENNLDHGVVFATFTYDPTGPVFRKNYEQVLDFPGMEDRMVGYDPDNYYSTFGTGKYTNTTQPYLTALRYGKLRNDERLRLVGNAVLDIKIFPWLIYKSNLGTDRSVRTQNQFNPQYYIDPFEKADVSSYYRSLNNNSSWTFENTLSFNNKFGDHSVSAVAGIMLEADDNDNFNARREGYENSDEQQWVLDAGTGTQTNGGGRNHRSLMSYLGRVNYSFADRYLLTVSVRADGSSKFMKEYRWATFPSFSIGWRISEEQFYKNLDQNVLSSLKLRAGWGQIGNQMGVGNNDFLSTVTQTNQKRYIFGASKTQTTGYSLQSMGNPIIQWETSTQTNFGIDFGMFSNKLSGSIEYYIKDTDDMLMQVPQPGYYGYPNNPWQNIGKVRNQGFEMQLLYQKRATTASPLGYSINLNLSTIKNEVIYLQGVPMPGGNERIGNVTMTQEGWPIGTFYGFVTDGIFQSQAEVDNHPMSRVGARPGDLRFKDLNADGIIDDNDRDNLGSPFPKFGGGLNLTMQYKSVDLGIFFQGQAGNKIFRTFKYYTHQKTGAFNLYEGLIESAWRAPGTLGPNDPGVASNTEFAFNLDPQYNTRPSDYYVEDGSYIRLKNIQLGFNLPNRVLQKASINGLRIYVGTYNLLTFTKYKGFDPEMAGNNNGDPRNFGIDYSQYPQSRSFTFGLTMTL